jgi:hypothetical protein
VSATTYLVTRPYRNSGLGANLLSMAAALYACEQTGRTLVVDWTGMVHLRDTQLNFFPVFFEPRRSWNAVPIVYAHDPDDPSAGFTYDPAAVLEPAAAQYGDLLAGRIDHPLVRLEAFHYRLFDASALPRPAVVHYTRRFFEWLTPRPFLRARLDEARTRFDRQVVIGLHVRSGNGEFAAGSQYWNRVNTAIFERDSFARRLQRACEDCVRRLPDAMHADSAIFIATDSQDMQQRLLKLPRAFALRQQFPPPGAGHQFADFDAARYGGYTDVESMTETIVDMLMLAECQGLVCNESSFNLVAQHKTMFFCGNVRLLERYFEHPIKRVARRVLRRG